MVFQSCPGLASGSLVTVMTEFFLDYMLCAVLPLKMLTVGKMGVPRVTTWRVGSLG